MNNKKCILILYFLISSNNLFSDVNFKVNKDIPEEFKSLYNKENINYIDVFVGETYLGVHKIKYSNKSIEIINPLNVFNSIIENFNIKKENYDLLLKDISKSHKPKCVLDKNCENNISINIDSKNLSADIKLNISIFNKENKRNIFINETTSDNKSYIQRLRFNYSKSFEKSNKLEYNLSSNSYLSKGNERLNFNWKLTDNNYRISKINYEKDYKLNKFLFGFISPKKYTNLSDTNNIFGLSFGSNFDTRKDLKGNLNEGITLNVKDEATVRIYKDNELLLTDEYNVGIHNVIVPNLPSGSYLLKVVYTYKDGTEDSENLIYSNNNSIPKTDNYIWNISLGNKTLLNNNSILSKISDDKYISLSLIKRIQKNISISSDITYDDILSLSPSIIYEINNLELNLSTKINNDLISYYSRVRYNKEKDNFDLYYSKMIYDDYTYHSFNFNYQRLFEDNTVLSFNYGKNIETNIDYYSLNYSRGIDFFDSGIANINFDFSNNGEENIYGISFNYNFSNKNERYKYNLKKYNNYKSHKLSYNKKTIKDLNSEYTNSFSLENLQNNTKFSYNNNYKNEKYLSSNLNVSHSKNTNTQIYGDISTNNIILNNSISFGGKEYLRSGVLIELSDNSKEEFSLFVDGNKKMKIDSKSSYFIPLRSYNTYLIGVEASEKNMFSKMKTKMKKVTLYPGNIQKIAFDSYSFKLVYLRIVDKSGTPIKNKKITTKNGVFFSDDQGYSSIELENNETFIVVDNKKCNLSINEDENLVFLEDVYCY